MTQRWNNCTADLFVPISCANPDGEWLTDTGRTPPPLLKKWLEERCADADGIATDIELSITVSSSGYNSPGTMYASNGDPGDPPEGDEERTVTSIEDVDGNAIPKELHGEITSWLDKEIEALTIDTFSHEPEADYDE